VIQPIALWRWLCDYNAVPVAKSALKNSFNYFHTVFGGISPMGYFAVCMEIFYFGRKGFIF
ncbi:MAG: hypothetical protein RR011_03250, partial [Oscillospiraceae bacterium]